MKLFSLGFFRIFIGFLIVLWVVHRLTSSTFVPFKEEQEKQQPISLFEILISNTYTHKNLYEKQSFGKLKLICNKQVFYQFIVISAKLILDWFNHLFSSFLCESDFNQLNNKLIAANFWPFVWPTIFVYNQPTIVFQHWFLYPSLSLLTWFYVVLFTLMRLCKISPLLLIFSNLSFCRAAFKYCLQ